MTATQDDIDAYMAHLQAIIDSRILPAAAMGIRVSNFSGDKITLSAPLEKNTNHHNTAFGGSLYSIAAVACWALLDIQCAKKALNADIVISKGNVEYYLPVVSDFLLTAQAVHQSELHSAIENCAANGRGDVVLEGIVLQNEKVAVKFTGHYSFKKRKG